MMRGRLRRIRGEHGSRARSTRTSSDRVLEQTLDPLTQKVSILRVDPSFNGINKTMPLTFGAMMNGKMNLGKKTKYYQKKSIRRDFGKFEDF